MLSAAASDDGRRSESPFDFELEAGPQDDLFAVGCGGGGGGAGQPVPSSGLGRCAICAAAATARNPRMLNCLHSFCQPCLARTPSSPSSVTCPVCGHVTALLAAGQSAPTPAPPAGQSAPTPAPPAGQSERLAAIGNLPIDLVKIAAAERRAAAAGDDRDGSNRAFSSPSNCDIKCHSKISSACNGRQATTMATTQSLADTSPAASDLLGGESSSSGGGSAAAAAAAPMGEPSSAAAVLRTRTRVADRVARLAREAADAQDSLQDVHQHRQADKHHIRDIYLKHASLLVRLRDERLSELERGHERQEMQVIERIQDIQNRRDRFRDVRAYLDSLLASAGPAGATNDGEAGQTKASGWSRAESAAAGGAAAADQALFSRMAPIVQARVAQLLETDVGENAAVSPSACSRSLVSLKSLSQEDEKRSERTLRDAFGTITLLTVPTTPPAPPVIGGDDGGEAHSHWTPQSTSDAYEQDDIADCDDGISSLLIRSIGAATYNSSCSSSATQCDISSRRRRRRSSTAAAAAPVVTISSSTTSSDEGRDSPPSIAAAAAGRAAAAADQRGSEAADPRRTHDQRQMTDHGAHAEIAAANDDEDKPMNKLNMEFECLTEVSMISLSKGMSVRASTEAAAAADDDVEDLELLGLESTAAASIEQLLLSAERSPARGRRGEAGRTIGGGHGADFPTSPETSSGMSSGLGGLQSDPDLPTATAGHSAGWPPTQAAAGGGSAPSVFKAMSSSSAGSSSGSACSAGWQSGSTLTQAKLGPLGQPPLEMSPDSGRYSRGSDAGAGGDAALRSPIAPPPPPHWAADANGRARPAEAATSIAGFDNVRYFTRRSASTPRQSAGPALASQPPSHGNVFGLSNLAAGLKTADAADLMQPLPTATMIAQMQITATEQQFNNNNDGPQITAALPKAPLLARRLSTNPDLEEAVTNIIAANTNTGRPPDLSPFLGYGVGVGGGAQALRAGDALASNLAALATIGAAGDGFSMAPPAAIGAAGDDGGFSMARPAVIFAAGDDGGFSMAQPAAIGAAGDDGAVFSMARPAAIGAAGDDCSFSMAQPAAICAGGDDGGFSMAPPPQRAMAAAMDAPLSVAVGPADAAVDAQWSSSERSRCLDSSALLSSSSSAFGLSGLVSPSGSAGSSHSLGGGGGDWLGGYGGGGHRQTMQAAPSAAAQRRSPMLMPPAYPPPPPHQQQQQGYRKIEPSGLVAPFGGGAGAQQQWPDNKFGVVRSSFGSSSAVAAPPYDAGGDFERQQQQLQLFRHHQQQQLRSNPVDDLPEWSRGAADANGGAQHDDLEAMRLAVAAAAAAAAASNAPPAAGEFNTMSIRSKFGQLGGGISMFNAPHGFCLGVNEDIVVADTNNHRIQVFDKTGYFRYQFGGAGKEEGMLWYPRKVAVNRETGHFIICDRGSERSRMQVFSGQAHFVSKIAIRFIDIVAGLAISREGHIVAVDSVTPTVFVISEAGKLIKYIECSDFMQEPSDIAVFGAEYYVCDFKGHSVVVLSEQGSFLRRIGNEQVTCFPNGIDISDAGDVLIGDSHGNQFHVAVFSNGGELLSQFQCPHVKVSRCCGLKITSEGFVVTLAKNNHHVLVLNTLYVS